VEDGKIHFIQNLAKHPVSGVFLYRFSHRSQIHAGSTGCYRLNEARNFLNALRGKLALEGIGIRRPKVITFRQCYQAWMEEVAPQRSVKYVRTLKCLIVKHVLPIIGGVQVTEIDSTAINGVLNLYLERYQATGANTVALHIGALLSFAESKGWIKDRPKISRIPTQKKSRPIIPVEALECFLEAVDAQGRLDVSFLVRAQILMGMRNHEARLMKWSGLRLEQKVFVPDKTKNGDAPVMPIPEVMLPWFEKLRQDGGTFGLICPGRGGKPRGNDYTAPFIKRAVIEAGLPEDITDHRLRASFANILNKRGVPLPTIQKLMRHSKVETTMIYIETREDEMRTAINLVG
jgi:integrase